MKPIVEIALSSPPLLLLTNLVPADGTSVVTDRQQVYLWHVGWFLGMQHTAGEGEEKLSGLW